MRGHTVVCIAAISLAGGLIIVDLRLHLRQVRTLLQLCAFGMVGHKGHALAYEAAKRRESFMRRRRVLTSFCLHHIDAIPIVARRGDLELLTALNVELTWMIVRHFLQSCLKKGEGLIPSSGSIGLQPFCKA